MPIPAESARQLNRIAATAQKALDETGDAVTLLQKAEQGLVATAGRILRNDGASISDVRKMWAGGVARAGPQIDKATNELGAALSKQARAHTMAGRIFANPKQLLRSIPRTTKAIRLEALRSVRRTWDPVFAEWSGGALLGTETNRKLMERIARQWARQGIVRVRVGKRDWEVDAYADMWARTFVAHVQTEQKLAELSEITNLVRVSDSPVECPKCRPWELRILEIDNA